MPYQLSADQAKRNLELSIGKDPDEEARVYDLSRQTGLDPVFVRQHADEIQRRRNLPDIEALDIEAPKTAEFYRDFNRARMAIDDSEGLSNVEKAAGFIKNFPNRFMDAIYKTPQMWDGTGRIIKDSITGEGGIRSIPRRIKEQGMRSGQAFKVGRQNAKLGRAYSRKIIDTITGNENLENDRYIAEIEKNELLTPVDDGFFETVLTAVPETLPIVMGIGENALYTGSQYAVGGAIGASIIGQPQLAPAAAKSMGTLGAKLGAIERMYEYESGLAFKEFLALKDEDGNPIDPKIAAAGAITVGIINAGLEYGGMASIRGLGNLIGARGGLKIGGISLVSGVSREAVANIIKQKTAKAAILKGLKEYGKGALGEGLTEALQEIANIVVGEGAKQASNLVSGTDFDFGAENWLARTISAGYEGFAAGVGLGTAGLVGGTANDIRSNFAAKKYAEGLSELYEKTQESILKERSSETFEDFVGQVSEGGDKVYIDQAFFQGDKAVVEEIAAALDINIDDVKDGHDIPVAMRRMMARLDPEQFNQIKDHVKPSPGAMSAQQANSYDFKAEAKRLAEKSRDIGTYGQQRYQHKRRIIKEGEAAGMPSAVTSRFFDNLERTFESFGMPDADKLDRLSKINIQAQAAADFKGQAQGAKVSIDTKAANQFKAAFPDTKIVDHTGSPVIMRRRVQKDFTEEDIGYYGKGYYFTTEPDVDGIPPQGEAVFLDIKNPYTWPESRAKLGVGDGPFFSQQLINELKAKGHDGIIIAGRRMDPKDNRFSPSSVVAFDKEQIKPAKDYGKEETLYQSIYGNYKDYDFNRSNLYSDLERSIKEKKFPEKTTAKNAINLVKGMTAGYAEKGGFIKKDELDWSGLLDFLEEKKRSKNEDGKKGMVTKEEILGHLRLHNVRIWAEDYKAAVENAMPDFWEDQSVYEDAWEEFSDDFNQGYFNDEMQDYVSEEVTDAWDDDNHKIWSSLSNSKEDYLLETEGAREAYQEFKNDVLDKEDGLNEAAIKDAWDDPYDDIWDLIDDKRIDYLEDFAQDEDAFNLFREDALNLDSNDILRYSQLDEARSEIYENHSGHYFERVVERAEENWRDDNGEVEKYKGYVVKGPYTDYKEIVFTWDQNREAGYEEEHWTEDLKNIFVHVRVDQRVTTTGEKILLVNEVQSNWSADLRNEGTLGKYKVFADRELDAEFKAEADAIEHGENLRKNPAGKYPMVEIESAETGYPDMPFRNSWRMVAMKEMVRFAARRGMDGIAWSTGRQQLYIYPNISTKINKLIYNEDKNTLTYRRVNDGPLDMETARGVYPRRLKKYISKDVADELLSREVDEQGNRTIEGTEIQYKGHGLKRMYDQIMGAEMKKFFKKKKWGNPKFTSEKRIRGGRKLAEGQELTEQLVQDAIDQLEFDRRYVLRDKIVEKMAEYYEEGREDLSLDMFDLEEKTYLEHMLKAPFEHEQIHYMQITPEIRAKARDDGFPLFQKEGDKPPRGAVSFATDQTLISLFESADQTTLFHESAHIVFREMQSMVESGAANETVVKDFQVIKDWLGVADATEITEYHKEEFAKGFETYLWEGKAPNAKLESAFQQIKKWFRAAYRRVLEIGLNIPLTDDIRSVFDRMLADDAAIRETAAYNGFEMPSKEHMDALGIVTEDRNYMQRLLNQAFDSAEQAMDKAKNKSRRQNLKQWRKDINQEIKDSPAFRFVAALRAGKGMDRARLEELYGKEMVDRLPHGTVAKDGLNPDSAIDGYFENLQSAMDTLTDMPTKKQYMDMRLEVLEKEHDSTFLPIDYLVDTNEYPAFLEILAKYENRDARGVTPKEAFQLYAEKKIGEKSVREAIRHDKYLAAMKRAARREADFSRNQNFEKAAAENELVRLNYEFTRFSVKARREVEKIFKKTQKIVDSKSIDSGYQDTIKVFASRFNLPFTKPLAKLDEIKSIGQLLDAEKDDPIDNRGVFSDFIVSPAIYDVNIDYRDLSMDQLREVFDAIRFLETRGRYAKEGKIAAVNMTFDETAAGIVENMRDLKSKRNWDALGKLKRASDISRKYFAMLDSLNFVAMSMSGYSEIGKHGTQGMATKAIANPFIDAQDRKTAEYRRIYKQMTPHFLTLQKFARRLRKEYGRRIRIEGATVPKELHEVGFKGYVTADHIIAMALNHGNKQNIERLYSGYEQLEPKSVEAWLNLLEEKDWDAIQGIWNVINSLYEPTNTVHKSINGYEMKKVQAEEFTRTFQTGKFNADGSPIIKTKKYPGGYYPIKFDPNLYSKASQEVSSKDDVDKLMGLQSSHTVRMAPGVTKGHTKARTEGVKIPLLLSTSVVTRHLEDAIHYIHFAEPVRDAYRLVKRADVSAEVIRHLGIDVHKTLIESIKYIARPRRETYGELDGWIEWGRARTTAFILAANLGVSIKQGFSLFGAAYDIGKLNLLKGYSVFMTLSPMQAWENIKSMSDFMSQRSDSMDRDLIRQAKAIDPLEFRVFMGDKSISLEDVRNFFFLGIRMFDTLAVMPIWNGAYMKHMKETQDHDAAVKYADNAVRRSQPSAQPIDLTNWQRSPGVKRLFSMFQTFTVAKYRQRHRFHYRAWRNGKMTFVNYLHYKIMDTVLPFMAMNLLFEYFRDGDLDDDEIWEVLLSTARTVPFTGLPFIDSIFGQYGGPLDSPISSGVNQAQNLARSTINYLDEGKDSDIEKAAWSMFHLVSFMTGVPASQFFRRWKKGEEDPQGMPGLKHFIPAHKK